MAFRTSSYRVSSGVVVIIIAAAVMFCLVAAQAVIYFDDNNSSRRVAEFALVRSESVTRARQAAAEKALRAGGLPCSQRDIENLRLIAFRSSYISDLGRIMKGRLSCSALWGRLEGRELPPPAYDDGFIRVWRANDVGEGHYSDSNLIAQGDVFTLSAPTAFDWIDPLGIGSIRFESSDGAFAFREINSKAKGGLSYHAVTRICSSFNGVCVRVSMPRRHVLGLSGFWVASLVFLGVFLGAGVAFAVNAVGRARYSSIQQRLAEAIANEKISLVYQPLRRIDGNALVGFEVLSRWELVSGEDIPPSVFVPVAKQFGMSGVLFFYVFSKAISDMAPVLRARSIDYISVNAESIDLEDDRIVGFIDGVISASGVQPSQIRIEVTERDDLVSPMALKNMRALTDLGYGFLIDDFGTGSSNFSHLAKSNFSGIKIDRIFVGMIVEDSPLRSVLPGMYEIACKLNIDVVVEGVETSAQAAQLCNVAPLAIGQGWYYGFPMSLSEAILLVSMESCERPVARVTIP